MKKPLRVIIPVLILFIFASLYFFWLQKDGNNSEGTSNTSRCVQEGGESYGEAPVVLQCCPGLMSIGAIDDNGERTYDVAYCTKCGNGTCKDPENQYNCPTDCK